MQDRRVIYVHRKQSPLGGLLGAALELLPGVEATACELGPLPADAPPSSLVLWDLCGYGRGEILELGRALKADGRWVVVACREQEAAMELPPGVGVLAVLTAIQDSAAVAASLDMALEGAARLGHGGHGDGKYESLAVLERAKHLLWLAKGWDEQRSHREIQRKARSENTTVEQVARGIVWAHEVFHHGQGG